MARRDRERGGSKRKKMLKMPDLSGVEGRARIEEGDHLVHVKAVEMKEGDKADYFEWQFSVVGGGVLYYVTSLSENSLWNLRSLLDALQVDIPDEDTEIDPSDYEGLPLMVNVEKETFEGKKRPRIVDFWPAEEEDDKKSKKAKKNGKADKDESGEEDEPKGKKGKSGKKDKEEPETIEQDAVQDMSEEELVELVEERELDVDLDDFKSLRKKKGAVIDALEAADLLAA